MFGRDAMFGLYVHLRMMQLPFERTLRGRNPYDECYEVAYAQAMQGAQDYSYFISVLEQLGKNLFDADFKDIYRGYTNDHLQAIDMHFCALYLSERQG